MHVSHLSLHDFRSYAEAEVAARAGVTAFVGRNGQGKTNLVEAVDYLARLASHRVASDAPLVRFGADHAVVRAAVVRDGREALLEVEINPGRSNRARVNRSPLPRARELLGLVRTVLFSPEDLALVKGDPSERRRFLDDLLVQRAPRFAGVRADYDRVLKQRNSLLKTAGIARRQGRSADERAVHARRLGLPPRAHRRRAARRPARPGRRPAAATSRQATTRWPRAPTRTDATMTYKPSFELPGRPATPPTATVLAEALLAEVERRRDDEIDRGRHPGRPAPRRPDADDRPAAGEGVRHPRRVLVVRARAAAGVLRPAPRRRRRPDPDPRRRVRRARHRAPRAAGRAGRRRRAGAGHRGGPGRRARPRCAGARIDVVDGKVLPGVA